jgi:hypothetical protein
METHDIKTNTENAPQTSRPTKFTDTLNHEILTVVTDDW